MIDTRRPLSHSTPTPGYCCSKCGLERAYGSPAPEHVEGSGCGDLWCDGYMVRREGHGADTLTTKDTNPKDDVGSTKVPLELIPPTADAHEALALYDGARKYGRYNWRIAGVRASIYVAALKRHIDDWFNGEDLAPDSLVHHLGHARACVSILIDAMECGKLVDDRLPYAPVGKVFERLKETVAHLNQVTPEPKAPFTLADAPAPEASTDGQIDMARALGSLVTNGSWEGNHLAQNARVRKFRQQIEGEGLWDDEVVDAAMKLADTLVERATDPLSVDNALKLVREALTYLNAKAG